MGEEIYEEQAESSIDNLQMEQISEAQLTKVVTTFCEKLDKLAGDVAYALAGGDFDKGMSAIKEIRNEINSGAVASFYSSKQKIVGMLAKGAKYGNSLTAEEQNNFDNTLAFLEAYRKFTPVFIGYNKILNLLESGALDCSYLNFLFVIYFDMIGLDKEFSYEISCVFRDFEELAEYYKNMDVDADYLAYTYFDAHTKEFERMERELDQKMSQTHPDAYKYLSPFLMHSVNEGMGKMKTIDNWTQQYRFMMKDVSKFHEAYKVIDEVLRDNQTTKEANPTGPFYQFIKGLDSMVRDIRGGMNTSNNIIEKFEANSDDNPYWIMKYQNNILSAKGKYGIGTTDPKEKGTDYYESFKQMSDILRRISFDTIDNALKKIRNA